MDSLIRSQAMAALKQKIAALENRPVLAAGASALAAEAEDRPLLAPPGLLHEMFTDSPSNAASVLGFALGQARGLLAPSRPAVLYLQLRHEAQETGLPYGAGLASFGFDPERLILGRVADINQLLWVMEEAVGCRAIAGVIADIGGRPRALDFTASRRLSLRANSAGASVFLMRYGRDREASAAQLRWHIAPGPSAPDPWDDQAPGPLRWRVTLEKGEFGARRANGSAWQIGWTEHGFVEIDRQSSSRAAFSRTPVHVAVPAALGDRLPQTA